MESPFRGLTLDVRSVEALAVYTPEEIARMSELCRVTLIAAGTHYRGSLYTERTAATAAVASFSIQVFGTPKPLKCLGNPLPQS